MTNYERGLSGIAPLHSYSIQLIYQDTEARDAAIRALKNAALQEVSQHQEQSGESPAHPAAAAQERHSVGEEAMTTEERSKTPRTDALKFIDINTGDPDDQFVVEAGECAKIERELAEAKKEGAADHAFGIAWRKEALDLHAQANAAAGSGGQDSFPAAVMMPRFIDVGSFYEICRFDSSTWLLRPKQGGHQAHLRYLVPIEVALLEAGWNARLTTAPKTTMKEPK